MRHRAVLLGLLAVMFVLGVSLPNVSFLTPESGVLQSFVTNHSSDLILNGTDTLTITADTYVETGNIILHDSASLILDHATLEMNLSFPFQYKIQLFDSGSLTATASNIQGDATFNLHLFNTTTLSLTTTVTKNVELQPSDASQSSFNSITLTQPVIAQRSSKITADDLSGQFSITLLDNSQASISRAGIRSLLTKGVSSLTLSNSSASTLWLTDGSHALISDSVLAVARLSLTGASTTVSLTPGAIVAKQIIIPTTGFNATFQRSQVGSWALDVSSSQLTVQQSKIDTLGSTASYLTISSSTLNTSFVTGGNVTFQGSNEIVKTLEAFQSRIILKPQVVYIPGIFLTSNVEFSFSGGSVVRMFTVQVLDASFAPAAGAHVTVATTGSPIVDGFTDGNGDLNFNLTFQQDSIVYRLSASGLGLQGSYPIQLTTDNVFTVQLGKGLPSIPGSLILLLLSLIALSTYLAKRSPRRKSCINAASLV